VLARSYRALAAHHEGRTVSTILPAALAYAKRGVPVLPLHWPKDGACSCGDPACSTPGKHPLTRHGKDDATTNPEIIKGWWARWPAANIGLRMGNGRVAVDIDPRNGGDESLHDLGPLPETVTSLTGSGGQHLLYKADGAVKARKGVRPGIDIITDGYIVAPPSRHISGRRYEWEVGHGPGQVALAPFPSILASLSPDGGTAAAPLPERILAGQRNDLLTSMAGSMRRRGASPEAIEAALAVENETRCEPPLAPSDVRRIAQSVGRYPVPEPVQPADSVRPDASDTPRFHRTDAGNGEVFAHLYGDRVRYDHRRRRWLLWRDHWWLPDADAEVERLALEAANWRYQAAASIVDLKERQAEATWAISSESRMRLDSALALARAWRPIADAGADWDSNPWLLGVANGVIDLRTGTLRDGKADDRLTMHSPVAYDPDAPYPHWLQFLDRVLGGNESLVNFLQRAVGYSLTGDVSEQVLFFLYGTGANGKSTFLGALLDALGDYGRQAAPGLLLAKRGERHPTEYADLEGARFVSSVEVDEGRRLAEGLVKWLTGGDRMKARHMRQDFYEFRPTYKIVLAANHRPTIVGTDLAIWRRIRLVPFSVVIPADEQDPCLPEKLRGELPGILAWAVEGCLAWQRDGLGTPQEVQAATEAYRAEQDVLAAFLDDCCIMSEDKQATASALYKAYSEWCKESGEKPLAKRAFGLSLGERGFTPDRAYQLGRLWHGVGLLMTQLPAENDAGAAQGATP
jgi:putative DNA primase/helicase